MMTLEELEALPVGPIVKAYGPATEAEAYRTHNVVSTYLVRAATKARYWGPDETMAFWDSEGRPWMIGEFASGGFYKKPL